MEIKETFVRRLSGISCFAKLNLGREQVAVYEVGN